MKPLTNPMWQNGVNFSRRAVIQENKGLCIRPAARLAAETNLPRIGFTRINKLPVRLIRGPRQMDQDF